MNGSYGNINEVQQCNQNNDSVVPPTVHEFTLLPPSFATTSLTRFLIKHSHFHCLCLDDGGLGSCMAEEINSNVLTWHCSVVVDRATPEPDGQSLW